jgi:hypothetical protein
MRCGRGKMTYPDGSFYCTVVVVVVVVVVVHVGIVSAVVIV